MSNRERVDAVRRERRKISSQIGSDVAPYEARGDIEVLQKPTQDGVRSLRTNLYAGGKTKRRAPLSSSRMVSPHVSRSTVSGSRSISRHRHKSTHAVSPEAEAKPRRREKSGHIHADSSHISVYGSPRAKERPKPAKVTRKLSSRRGGESDDESRSTSVTSEDLEPAPRKRRVKIIYIDSEEPRSPKHHSHKTIDSESSRTSRHHSNKIITDNGKAGKDEVKSSEKAVYRSNTTSSRRSSTIQPLDIFKRTVSARDVRDVRESRPALKRSNTVATSSAPSKSLYEPSITSTQNTSRRSSIFGSIFAPLPKEQKPVKLVECLTCLSDDIPVSKSAKLKCGHRMCHSCLKRIFKLSVNDPQHMPPKCCTSNHIPLKHVDKLFDIPFKKLWNKKFQEYTTKNRIYCPSRRCGEWIQPGSIHTEGGKKYGKCGKCKTKVCCLCNGKWHGSKDCPKDEETNALLEAAKQAGWQRCYSCRTMVELKEGCNHMTCRCRAEFCMICGLKWKTCNCPWFNYDQVEQDRLEHMRIPADIADRLERLLHPERPGQFQRAARPGVYDEGAAARRRQEHIDEELARRLQSSGIFDDDDLTGPFGVVEDIGNNNGHFMNQNYRRPAPNPLHRSGNYLYEINRARGVALDRPAPPPMPLPAPTPLQASDRAEQVVPRRTGTDYATEAARHAPVPPATAPRPARPAEPAPRPSVLAGLGGSGRGSGRVSAWRAHVEPGVTPAEGVLSM